MLTLQDIIDEVQIGTRSDLRDEMSEANFANRVGRRWANMHRWRYLDGGSFVFATVADQVDYDLPADLGEFQVTYGEKDEYTAYDLIHMVPWADWHAADRRDFGTFYGRFLGSSKNDVVTIDGIKQNRHVLSLTPKPTQDRELRLVYRRTWAPLANAADVANIPGWADEPFLELTRLVAIALNAPSTDGNPDPMGAMVNNFKQGSSFADAKKADGLIQPNISRGAGALDIARNMNGRGKYGPRWTGQDLLADV